MLTVQPKRLVAKTHPLFLSKKYHTGYEAMFKTKAIISDKIDESDMISHRACLATFDLRQNS